MYFKTFLFSHKVQDLVTAIHNGTGDFVNDLVGETRYALSEKTCVSPCSRLSLMRSIVLG